MIVTFDALVIGGGPAGASIARLLASWGHSVLVLTRAMRTPGLAESLPPSSRKLLAAIGVLDRIDAAGFYRGAGNTVWWGEREGTVEPYTAPDGALGYQVFRPDLDALLLQAAADAGAQVQADARVTRVQTAAGITTVDYSAAGGSHQAHGRFVLDCSGRAGVIARPFRRYEPHYRMQALIGVWTRPGGWALADDSHTVVETCEEGWAWSIPIGSDIRHLVVMVDGSVSRLQRGESLERTYLTALASAPQVEALGRGAALQRAWACDASLYSSSVYADETFLLVGDAGTCIDPLSSYGVKKALASAWVGAVATHTALVDSRRRHLAGDFFAAREREMYAANLDRSRQYAREACQRYPRPFWARRSAVEVDGWSEQVDEQAMLRTADVGAAFASLREADRLGLTHDGVLPVIASPLIDGREVILEDALQLPGVAAPIRYFAGIDLLRLCELARQRGSVPDLFESYCRVAPAPPLQAFLQALSLLIARGVVTTDARSPV
jgi:flavin-dependent dehydrogenase